MKATIFINYEKHEVYGNFEEAWDALITENTEQDFLKWCHDNGWEFDSYEDIDLYDTDAWFEFQDEMLGLYYTTETIDIF